MKISFKNDYSEGCHPQILTALTASNLVQQDGYGGDQYSQNAASIILQKLKAPQSKVHFVSGGTQANLVIISAFLRPHESVIAATTGHIFDNETGAIEATGHKVNEAQAVDGKLTPETVQQVLDAHPVKPHQLKQKMVYISNSTEIGTVYCRDEIIALSMFCRANNLYLFMDGARLGHALMSEQNDLTLADIAQYTDAFYIGGTKNGALIGEAIVINNIALQEDFEYHLKQKGAMLSKGRLLGIQFETLFQDDLYFQLAEHANQQAMKIKQVFELAKCDWWANTNTNQIFPILENSKIALLAAAFDFYVWRKIDDNYSAIRLITSWATTEESVDLFIKEVKKVYHLQ